MFYTNFECNLTSTCYKRSEDFLAVVTAKSEAGILNTGTGSDGSNFFRKDQEEAGRYCKTLNRK
jgi:hypothetical protein